MELFPQYPHFLGGLVSQKAIGRVDTDQYLSMLSQCHNWRILPNGGLSLREGSRFKRAASGDHVRLFTFKVDGGEDYVVEVSENMIRLYNEGGNLISGDTQLLTNNRFVGWDGWKVGFYDAWQEPPPPPIFGSALYQKNYAGKYQWQANPDAYTSVNNKGTYPLSGGAFRLTAAIRRDMRYFAAIEQVVTVSTPTDPHTLSVDLASIVRVGIFGPYSYPGIGGVVVNYELDPDTGEVWDPPVELNDIGARVEIRGYDNPDTVIAYADKTNGVGTLTLNFTPGASNSKFRVLIRTHQPATTPTVSPPYSLWYPDMNTPWLPGSVPTSALLSTGKAGATYLWYTVSFNDLRLVNDNDDTGGLPVEFENDGIWTDVQLPVLQADYNSGTREMWFVHPEVAPYRMIQDVDTGDWTFEPVTFTTPPALWDASNYPSLVRFHEARVWLARTPHEKMALWASQPGSFSDFTVTTDPDSALQFELNFNGMIQYLASSTALIIGTTAGDIALTSAGGIVLQDDYDFKRNNGVSSGFGLTCTAGNEILYTSREVQKIKSIGYDAQDRNQWTSKDLTFWSDAVKEAGGVLAMGFAHDPEYRLIILCRNGNVVEATFEPVARATSWWTSEYALSNDGSCTISDICITQDNRGSMLWMAIRYAGEMQIHYVFLSDPASVRMDAMFTGIVETDGKCLGLAGMSRVTECSTVVVNPALGERAMVDLADTVETDGVIHALKLSLPGTGYSVNDVVPLTGGSGAGAEIKVLAVDAGKITDFEITDYGTGYALDELLTGSGPGNDDAVFKVFQLESWITVSTDYAGWAFYIGQTIDATAKTLKPHNLNPTGSSILDAMRWNYISALLNDSGIVRLNGKFVLPKNPLANYVPPSGNLLDQKYSGLFTASVEGLDDGVITVTNYGPYKTEVVGLFGKLSRSHK